MPRICTSANDPIDFCRKCFPTEAVAQKKFGLATCGEGPDARGDCFTYDNDHPDYDGEDYVCWNCRRRLTAADN